jgi:tripartite-type tricarboxylate transporter receptor subunit TctC
MTKSLGALIAFGWLFAVAPAQAQSYPSRPVTMIVPFSAGGPTDTIARIFAERIGAALGQTVIVENVTGVSGSIGVGRVARAAPDGHTLSIGHWSTHGKPQVMSGPRPSFNRLCSRLGTTTAKQSKLHGGSAADGRKPNFSG